MAHMITALLLLPSLALAQVPSSLAYQGRLYGSDELLAETTERLELCRRLLADYLAEKGCR